MKVTLENWNYVQQKLREVGIRNEERNSKEELQALTTKDGERFEFSRETFEQFKNAGLLKIGRRLVVIRKFYSTVEADIAKQSLISHGVQAFISKDDEGGMMPALQATQGVLLRVLEKDRTKAETILKALKT